MLIMLSGYDRCGKDSAFEAIQMMIPDAKRIAQADHLKEVCFEVYGVTESMKGTGAEEYYRMCLTKASEIMKIASGSITYFSEYLVNKIGFNKLVADDTLYVCTDGRYDYEIEYFAKEFNGRGQTFFPLQITRPEVPPTKYALDNHNFPQYKGFSYEINNDSNIKEFMTRVQMVTKLLLEGDA